MRIFEFRLRQFDWRSWSIGWMCGIGFCAVAYGVKTVNETATATGLLALLVAAIMYRCLPLKTNDKDNVQT